MGIVGFTYSLLVWAYECTPLLIKPHLFYAQKVDERNPKMLNWVVDSYLKWKDLADRVFDNGKVVYFIFCTLYFKTYCELYQYTKNIPLYIELIYICLFCHSLNSVQCYQKKNICNEECSIKVTLQSKMRKLLKKENAQEMQRKPKLICLSTSSDSK